MREPVRGRGGSGPGWDRGLRATGHHVGQTPDDLHADDIARVEHLRLMRIAFKHVSSLSSNSLFLNTNNYHCI